MRSVPICKKPEMRIGIPNPPVGKSEASHLIDPPRRLLPLVNSEERTSPSPTVPTEVFSLSKCIDRCRLSYGPERQVFPRGHSPAPLAESLRLSTQDSQRVAVRLPRSACSLG